MNKIMGDFKLLNESDDYKNGLEAGFIACMMQHIVTNDLIESAGIASIAKCNLRQIQAMAEYYNLEIFPGNESVPTGEKRDLLNRCSLEINKIVEEPTPVHKGPPKLRIVKLGSV